MVDVVGLYLEPPERAVVFSFHVKTQCQALDRTQPRYRGNPVQQGPLDSFRQRVENSRRSALGATDRLQRLRSPASAAANSVADDVLDQRPVIPPPALGTAGPRLSEGAGPRSPGEVFAHVETAAGRRRRPALQSRR